MERLDCVSHHAGFTVAERCKRRFWQPKLGSLAGIVLMSLIQGEDFPSELGKAHSVKHPHALTCEIKK